MQDPFALTRELVRQATVDLRTAQANLETMVARVGDETNQALANVDTLVRDAATQAERAFLQLRPDRLGRLR